MALKSFKPYTKSTRGTVVLDKSQLWKGAPFKPLTKGQNFTGGRNNNGRITSRHIGGGSKHKYRIIDFYRKKKNVLGFDINERRVKELKSGKDRNLEFSKDQLKVLKKLRSN